MERERERKGEREGEREKERERKKGRERGRERERKRELVCVIAASVFRIVSPLHLREKCTCVHSPLMVPSEVADVTARKRFTPRVSRGRVLMVLELDLQVS
jgi:hypothetical protein